MEVSAPVQGVGEGGLAQIAFRGGLTQVAQGALDPSRVEGLLNGTGLRPLDEGSDLVRLGHVALNITPNLLISEQDPQISIAFQSPLESSIPIHQEIARAGLTPEFSSLYSFDLAMEPGNGVRSPVGSAPGVLRRDCHRSHTP